MAVDTEEAEEGLRPRAKSGKEVRLVGSRRFGYDLRLDIEAKRSRFQPNGTRLTSEVGRKGDNAQSVRPCGLSSLTAAEP